MRWQVAGFICMGVAVSAAGVDHADLALKAVCEFSIARQADPARPGIDKDLGLAFFKANDFAHAIPELIVARSEQP